MTPTPDIPIPIAYVEIVERFARDYGTPIPSRLLEIGTDADGWRVRLNASFETVDGVLPFQAHPYWHGWLAGIVTPSGGTIAAGSAANEDALIAWLRSDTEPTE